MINKDINDILTIFMNFYLRIIIDNNNSNVFIITKKILMFFRFFLVFGLKIC